MAGDCRETREGSFRLRESTMPITSKDRSRVMARRIGAGDLLNTTNLAPTLMLTLSILIRLPPPQIKQFRGDVFGDRWRVRDK